MTEYTREQLSQLYKKLPRELKDWVVSDDANDAIYQILERNDLLGNIGGTISDLIRNVLFGLLPPENFQNALEKETDLKSETVKHIGQEINRFVFFPIKETLSELYHPIVTATPIMPTAKTEQKPTPAAETPETIKPIYKNDDDYLEKIE